MTDYTLEQAFTEIAREYQESGSVNTTRWLQEMPESTESVVDVIAMLKLGGHLTEADQKDDDVIWEGAGQVVSDILTNYPNDMTVEEASLGEAVQAARTSRPPNWTKSKLKFCRAVVYAWTFDVLRGENDRSTVYSTGKAVYLLENALRLNLFIGHQKMAYGPYDPKLKYGAASHIASSRRWFFSEQDGKLIRAGDNIGEVWKYAPKYLGDPDLAAKLISYVSKLDFAELELMTTVLWAARELRWEGGEVSASEIHDRLMENWDGKADRSHFSEASVAGALRRLERLSILT